MAKEIKVLDAHYFVLICEHCDGARTGWQLDMVDQVPQLYQDTPAKCCHCGETFGGSPTEARLHKYLLELNDAIQALREVCDTQNRFRLKFYKRARHALASGERSISVTRTARKSV